MGFSYAGKESPELQAAFLDGPSWPAAHRPPSVSAQLFSSTSEGFSGFGRGVQLFLTGLHSGRSLPGPAGLPHLIWASYVVLQLWCLSRLFPAVLIHRYRETRFEMYRPAFESQDYEMVELFLRRLKMWMGFSKAKEVRGGGKPGLGGSLWGSRAPLAGLANLAGQTHLKRERSSSPQVRLESRLWGDSDSAPAQIAQVA